MFHADTGAANEHVPLNDAGYFLPLWQVSAMPQLARALSAVGLDCALTRALLCSALHPPCLQRLVLRSAYVLIITLVAICMPFFTAVVGLVG